MADVLTPDGSNQLEPPHSPEAASRRVALTRARQTALGLALIVAIAITTRSGLGLGIVVGSSMVAVARVVGWRTVAGRWCLLWSLASAVLIIRDNAWLGICVVATAALVAAISLSAHASGQSVLNFAASRISRRDAPVETWSPAPMLVDRRVVPFARGMVLAAPVVVVFAALLASADEVFAELVSFDAAATSFGRMWLFLLAAVVAVPILQAGADPREGFDGEVKTRLGAIEASVVLGSVNALFLAFVVLRSMRLGEQLPDELFRSDVRAGFFQLLFVAALTVLLVLAVKRYGGEAIRSGRVRGLAFTAVGLAAAIDGLAMIRIGQYVEQSFTSPLRFWSNSFGIWLLIVLGLTALRMTSVASRQRWFTFAIVSTWMLFVASMAIVNPDVAIAEHNFANPPTGEDQYISVMPLIWLSEDATGVIVENIEALRPLPNDRFDRMVAHLCSAEDADSWRDLHFSRSAADSARGELCSTQR